MHIPLILPPSRKLQKPSKKSGMFKSFGTINFVFFLLKGRVKRGGGAWPNAPLPKYAPASFPTCMP